MIIIVRFGENNVLCPKYIDIYDFLRGGRGVHGERCRTYMVHHTFFLLLKKTEKVQEHDHYFNQILHFDLQHFFLL